jgi:hypothetical protein
VFFSRGAAGTDLGEDTPPAGGCPGARPDIPDGESGLTTLARIYRVATRTLNQAVKRNRARFPADFLVRLTREEAESVARSRSQSVILNQGGNIKYPPLGFTEHGAVMAATVLNSPRDRARSRRSSANCPAPGA